MNKSIYALVAIACFVTYAQEKTKSERDYNVFSVEANVGQHKPNEVFSPGYFSANPDKYMNFQQISHFDLGFRYMLNEKFGLKLDFAYNTIKPEPDNGSLDFEGVKYRIGLQGVINLRNVLNFRSWTKRIGLLVHGGLQVSRLDPTYRVDAAGIKDMI
jgi:OOP family OmpA-OmpF porin